VRQIKPPWCNQCGLPLNSESFSASTCFNCHNLELQFERARALIAARGLGLEIVHRFKYEPADFFEPLMQWWLRTAIPFPMQSHDWIVPIPLHPVKKRQRGFNQAKRIAKPVSIFLKKPLISNAIERVKNTETQTYLPPKMRFANVEGAFAAKNNHILNGSVLLIDDVMTTGATASACARALKMAGAKKVDVLTLTRGLLP
jgi:ComF family protein